MKIKTLLLFGLFYSTLFLAQEKTDTISSYICTTRFVRNGSVKTYSVDGKSVSKAEFQRVMKQVEEKKKCNPCYLKQYTTDDKIHSSGMFYYVCPGSKKEKTEEKTGRESKTLFLKSNSCQEGEWKYYDADGKVERTEFYKAGEKVNESAPLE